MLAWLPLVVFIILAKISINQSKQKNWSNTSETLKKQSEMNSFFNFGPRNQIR